MSHMSHMSRQTLHLIVLKPQYASMQAPGSWKRPARGRGKKTHVLTQSNPKAFAFEARAIFQCSRFLLFSGRAGGAAGPLPVSTPSALPTSPAAAMVNKPGGGIVPLSNARPSHPAPLLRTLNFPSPVPSAGTMGPRILIDHNHPALGSRSVARFVTSPFPSP